MPELLQVGDRVQVVRRGERLRHRERVGVVERRLVEQREAVLLGVRLRERDRSAAALVGGLLSPAIADSSVPVYSGYIWICPEVSAFQVISEEPMLPFSVTL